MSGLPIPPALLKPLLDQALKLAQNKLAKGNPLVGAILEAGEGLIDAHGAKVPAELAPAKRQISASLAADFEAMKAAGERAHEAGKWRPPGG